MKYVTEYYDRNGDLQYDKSDYIATLKYNAKQAGAQEIKISKITGFWETYQLDRNKEV